VDECGFGGPPILRRLTADPFCSRVHPDPVESRNSMHASSIPGPTRTSQGPAPRFPSGPGRHRTDPASHPNMGICEKIVLSRWARVKPAREVRSDRRVEAGRSVRSGPSSSREPQTPGAQRAGDGVTSRAPMARSRCHCTAATLRFPSFTLIGTRGIIFACKRSSGELPPPRGINR
jgi:hypothetical protein